MTEFKCPTILQWISKLCPHHWLGLNDAIETCVSGQVTPLVAAFTCERHSSPRYALTSVRGPWSLLVQRQHLRVFDLSLDSCPRLRGWEAVYPIPFGWGLQFRVYPRCYYLQYFALWFLGFCKDDKCLPSTPLFLKIPQLEHKPPAIFLCWIVSLFIIVSAYYCLEHGSQRMRQFSPLYLRFLGFICHALNTHCLLLLIFINNSESSDLYFFRSLLEWRN